MEGAGCTNHVITSLQTYLTDGHVDDELLHAGRQTFAKDGQRRRALGRYQHALSLGQVRADDVGDGVRLATSRRSFHDDGRCSVRQQLMDSELRRRRR